MKLIIKAILLSVWFITISNYAICQNVTSERKPPQSGSTEVRAYKKPGSSNRLFKTPRGNFGVWADPSKWVLADRKANQETDFQLDHVSGDGYVMVISERISMPVGTLKDIAYENAKRAGPDARIVSEERRIVNGREILSLIIEATVKGIPFTYYGYYYSGKEGTVQVLTMTGQNLFQEYQPEFTELLNGLVIFDKPTPPSLPLPEIVQVDPRLEPKQDGPVLADSKSGAPSSGPGSGGGIGPGHSPDGKSDTPIASTSVDKKPVPLNAPRPSYTVEARKNQVEGVVRARALVGADGTVKQVRIVHGLPDGLDEMAIRAIYQIRFKPAMKDDKPVPFWQSIEVEFKLCTDCTPQKQ